MITWEKVVFWGVAGLKIDMHRDVTAGICCFILTFILFPLSRVILADAYFASTLRTTLDA